jgi:hypothetical protein
LIKQRETQLENAYKNIDKIREEMIENNFLPVEVGKGKVIKFQDKINKKNCSNFAFLNNVFESLNTLKNEGNMKIQEEKQNPSKETIPDQSKDEDESINEEKSEENSIIPENENQVCCKVFLICRIPSLFIILKS